MATNIAFPFVLIAFAFTSTLPLALLLAFGLGVGFMMQFTTINTLLQTRVEDDYRGVSWDSIRSLSLGLLPSVIY